MAQRDRLEGCARRLVAAQELKMLLAEHLLDCPQSVRPFRMARRIVVLKACGVRDQERRHSRTLCATWTSGECRCSRPALKGERSCGRGQGRCCANGFNSGAE